MKREEQEADVFLEAAGLLRRGSGVHTARNIVRKARKDAGREVYVDGNTPPEVVACVVERWVEELVEVAGLSVLQEVCFRLFFERMPVRTIARRLGRPRQVILRRIAQARRKLRAAYGQGKYAGWYEVYLSEVRRYVYRPPRRCV